MGLPMLNPRISIFQKSLIESLPQLVCILSVKSPSSIQLFFLWNCSSNKAPTWCHFACSLKKRRWDTAGSFLKWGGVCCLLKAREKKRQYWPWKTEVNIGVLPSSVDYKIRFSIFCCVVIRFQHWINSYCLAWIA